MPRALAASAARTSESRSPWRRRDQHRDGVRALDHVEGRLGEAEQEIRARERAAAKLFLVAGVHANPESRPLEAPDSLLKVRERHAGHAAQVNDIRPLLALGLGAGEQGVGGQARRVHDLGEDADVVVREIGRLALQAEETGQVRDFVRPPLEAYAERIGEPRLVQPGAPWKHHTVGLDRARQPPQHDRLRHQRRDLDADVGDLPGEGRLAQPVEQAAKARLGEVAGQEQDALRHDPASGTARPDARRAPGSRSGSSSLAGTSSGPARNTGQGYDLVQPREEGVEHAVAAQRSDIACSASLLDQQQRRRAQPPGEPER